VSFIDAFHQSGIFGKLSMVVAFGPLSLAILYLARPAERTLALMRPASLAAIFAGVAGLIAGLMAILMGISATPSPSPVTWSHVYLGLSEALVAPFVNFGSLAAAWLLVALGMMRRPRLESSTVEVLRSDPAPGLSESKP
jgi:hypothetical protein